MEVNNQLTENMTGACWNRYAAGKPTQGYDVTIADKQREDEQTVDGQHGKLRLLKVGGRHAKKNARNKNTAIINLQAHTVHVRRTKYPAVLVVNTGCGV